MKTAYLQPLPSRSTNNVSFRMQEDEFLPCGCFRSQQESLVLSDARIISHANNHDIIRLQTRPQSGPSGFQWKTTKTYLSDTSLRPRRTNRRVRHIQHDTISLLLIRQPSSDLQFTHPRESMSANMTHHRCLIEVRRRSTDLL